MSKKTILIIDDELGIRELLKECLEDEGYRTHVAASATEASKFLREQDFDLILLDVWLPDMDGLSLYKRLVMGGLKTPVIMMSGHASITNALEAIRQGAKDFLEKPLSLAKLLPVVSKYLVSDEEEGKVASGKNIFSIDMANIDFKTIKEELERSYLLYHLESNAWNMSELSRISGIDRGQLYRKFKALNINIKV